MVRMLVEPHNPNWAFNFQDAKKELSSILSTCPPIDIVHIGSTSIPGLPAKPVIDLIIITSPSSVPATQALLEAAGYVCLGDWGIPERLAFRQPGYDINSGDGSNAKPELGIHGTRWNTYVMVPGSTALRNNLDVKRVLLEDEELRREYGETKMKLTETDFEQKTMYTWGKTKVALKILRKAGWSEEELVEAEKTGNS